MTGQGLSDFPLYKSGKSLLLALRLLKPLHDMFSSLYAKGILSLKNL